ncbi:MAG: hypothetical protein ACE5HS_10925 [bacterium]
MKKLALILFSTMCFSQSILLTSCSSPTDADGVELSLNSGWPAITIAGYHRYREPGGSYRTYDMKYDFLSRRISWKKDYEKDDKSKRVTVKFHSVEWRQYDSFAQEAKAFKVDVFNKTFSWP